MNKPPDHWPFRGHYYPEGAKLVVLNLCPIWLDLAWYDPKRELNVYLSTIPRPNPDGKCLPNVDYVVDSVARLL
jgi:hypothetical protein